MSWVYLIAVLATLTGLLMLLIRLWKGPSVYDRMLAANLSGTKILLFIVLLSMLVDDMMYIDIALLYGLLNFIATIAFMKYVRYRSFRAEAPSAQHSAGEGE